MHLRDGNIIVCDCGAELNPEITAPQGYIIYTDGVATCSNCSASEAIEIPNTKNICPMCGQVIQII